MGEGRGTDDPPFVSFSRKKKRGKGEEEVSDEECTLAIGTQVEETGSVTIKIRRSWLINVIVSCPQSVKLFVR